MEERNWLLYGAYGFTGQLIAERAFRESLPPPTLAGRSATRLEPLARRYSFPFSVFSLDDRAELRHHLEGYKLVVLAAGPFTRTAKQVMEACLEVGCDYLDITGEIQVFEYLYSLHERALRRGITMVSGMGFDCVPTDCLAKEVCDLLPKVSALELCVYGVGKPSGGTVASLLGVFKDRGFLKRKEDRLVSIPWGEGGRWFELGRKTLWAIPVPLADLVSARRSTGVTTITTYAALPPAYATFFRWLSPLLRLGVKLPGVLSLLQSGARVFSTPPSAEERQHTESWVLARAQGEGSEVTRVLRTLEGYEFTAEAVVKGVKEFLTRRESIPPGALTPAQALGKEFVYTIPGTVRVGE